MVLPKAGPGRGCQPHLGGLGEPLTSTSSSLFPKPEQCGRCKACPPRSPHQVSGSLGLCQATKGSPSRDPVEMKRAGPCRQAWKSHEHLLAPLGPACLKLQTVSATPRTGGFCSSARTGRSLWGIVFAWLKGALGG